MKKQKRSSINQNKAQLEQQTGRLITKEEYIRRAKEVHGDKYDYSELPPLIWIGEDDPPLN